MKMNRRDDENAYAEQPKPSFKDFFRKGADLSEFRAVTSKKMVKRQPVVNPNQNMDYTD